MNLGRAVMMAEMHGRDLVRRHIALVLLIALPLSFYLASAGTRHGGGISSGGVSMAFAVGGATLFSTLSSMEVDQRLVLGGYRPFELLVGRLLFLAPLGLVISAGFSSIMSVVSHPENPWLVGLGVAVVALQSVPFGLAVGGAVPRELEGTLVLIGIVGIQLSVETTTWVAKVLPFYGPRRLIEAGVDGHGAVLVPLLITAAYGLALMITARAFIGPRLAVHRHSNDGSFAEDVRTANT